MENISDKHLICSGEYDMYYILDIEDSGKPAHLIGPARDLPV